ncbi:unnamed protein product [Prunus armeniaca]
MVSYLVPQWQKFEIRWKHFVAKGKPNPKRELIPPFGCGNISWYLPKERMKETQGEKIESFP